MHSITTLIKKDEANKTERFIFILVWHTSCLIYRCGFSENYYVIKKKKKTRRTQMGTQQILLIVLSVIIVGVAVSVGIQMFNTQKDSGAMQAIATDLQSFGAQLIAFENTPSSMGGARTMERRVAVLGI